MNPFTRYLLGGRREEKALQAFIEHWDALEALVIRIFRGKNATDDDESEYRKLHPWLVENYPTWQEKWRPLWQEALVGGVPAGQDPFQRLLTAEKAADFIGDWQAMQHLPVARETINRYVQVD
jgi:hypothetical protein